MWRESSHLGNFLKKEQSRTKEVVNNQSQTSLQKTSAEDILDQSQMKMAS